MIVEYFRPQSLEETISLLLRPFPETIPLGGGIKISRGVDRPIAVVDLQKLGMDQIQISENQLKIGAMVTLQKLFDNIHTPQGLKEAIQKEVNFNLRQTASIAGTIVCSDGLSPLACVLLALSAKIKVEPGGGLIEIEKYLESDRGKYSKLITNIIIPKNLPVKFSSIGRSPSDKPMICVSSANLGNGKYRIALSTNNDMPVVLNIQGELKTFDISHRITPSDDFHISSAITLTNRLLSQV